MDKRTKLIMSQVMLPSQANVAGNVHGGEIMKLMEKTCRNEMQLHNGKLTDKLTID